MALTLLGAAGACSRQSLHPPLELLAFRQNELQSVALNEELLFFFSEAVDPSSITSESVRIVDESNREVVGERILRGNTLSFRAALPCASDLSDGGLRPAERYRVTLGGFPRPDGIRSESGALLSSTLLLRFATATTGAGPLFLDPFMGPFTLLTRVEHGTVILELGEAIDPSSVPASAFVLSRLSAGATEPEEIPMRARLVINRRDHAEMRLEPVDAELLPGGGLPAGRYYLSAPGGELRTLGGRSVELGPLDPFKPLLVPPSRITIDLGNARERPGQAPPGCAGTALWSSEARALVVRYPAAAGDGSEGAVELAQPPPGSEVRATQLTIPDGAVIDLSGHVGPVVLRSQTSLDVRGRLVRRNSVATGIPRGYEIVRGLRDQPETFSAWIDDLLHDQARSSEPWTVLVAGGDLRVPRGGSIEVDGPLVLVAGGWIRADGNVLARLDLWKTPEGGGVSSHSGVKVLPLRIDAPSVNPLRTYFSAGAVTRAFGGSAGLRAWLTGDPGSGHMGVQFLDASKEGRGPSGTVGPDATRALVRLELEPGQGEPWDPPRLETLELEVLAPAGSPR